VRPQFRFTLSNTTLGNQVISEPEGWADIKINLDRDMNYHSLIETFDVPLTFYGSGGGIDGGYNFIKAALANGIDEEVIITVDVRYDSADAYSNLFYGTVDLSTQKEIDFRKIQCAIIRDAIWAKFINRKETPVNLLSTTDVDGNPITAITSGNINLPSQTIRTIYRADMTAWTAQEKDDIFYNFSYLVNPLMDAPPLYGSIDLPEVSSDEIEDRYTYFAEIAGDIYESIRFKYKATVEIDIQLVLSSVPYSSAVMAGDQANSAIKLRIYKNWGDDGLTGELIAIATRTDLGTNGVSGRTVFTYQGLVSFEAGESLTYFFDRTVYTSQDLYLVYNDFYENSYIDIKADTLDEDSTTDMVQIGEAALSILRQITCYDNVMVSPYLLESSYCGYEFILMLGAHVRGWSMTDKQIALSFDKWWNGANPIMNLGLGYEDSGSPSNSTIFIGPKGDFYDATESLQLYGVNNIEVEFDQELLTKLVEVGFQKWDVEADVGSDDPQTRKTYRTRYKSLGKELKLISSFYAASAGIEETRRHRKETGKDYRLDEEVFIIATMNNAGLVEVFNGSPNGVTGLLNSETRYNIRLTPARMLQAWLNFLSGQLYEAYPAEKFYYSRGEGNTEMEWDGDDLCAVGTLSENQDLPLEEEYLFQPIIYRFTHPLTWDEYTTIRDNRKKAVGINYYDHDGVQQHVTLYVKKLAWHINRAVVEFEGWLANGVTPPPAPTPIYFTIEAESIENLDSGDPTYQVVYGSGSPAADFVLVGTDSDSVSTSAYQGDGLIAVVTRTGVAEAAIIISWIKNGLTLRTVQVPPGSAVNESYTFLNIQSGDVLEVLIIEKLYIYLESISATMNNPWSVIYELLDVSDNVLDTVTHTLTLGFGQTEGEASEVQAVDAISARVRRDNDGEDADVDDYTTVLWILTQDGIETIVNQEFVLLGDPFDMTFVVEGVNQGDRLNIVIYEG
jgi:hypothetical protein